MARGIDHIIHLVRDLDAAALSYGRIGFQVGPRNKHPFGTHNRLVQLDGCYIEILAIAEPEKIMGDAAPDRFAQFHRDFLARHGEGLTGLVLSSGDAAADKAAFDKAGFGGFPVFDFARKGLLPDGSEVDLAFSLAFAHEAASPDAMFVTVQHKRPENFWFKELQRHDNGASHVSAAIFAAESPTDHQYFLQAFTGLRDIRSSSLGVSADTPRGIVQITEPRPFENAFGALPPASKGMRFGAVVFGGDAARLRAAAAKSGLAFHEWGGRFATRIHGALLCFDAG